MFLSVISKPQQCGGLGLSRGFATQEGEKEEFRFKPRGMIREREVFILNIILHSKPRTSKLSTPFRVSYLSPPYTLRSSIQSVTA